jgi:hypothetical protein
MAGPIISKLLTDFFNEIGQERHFRPYPAMSATATGKPTSREVRGETDADMLTSSGQSIDAVR